MTVRNTTFSTIMVAIGGGLGAALRYGIQTLFGTHAQGFSLALVNVIGCFLIGYLTHHVLRKEHRPLSYAFLVPGFLGGFTSFSAFMVIVMAMVGGQLPHIVFVYTLGYVLMCVLAVALGRTASKIRFEPTASGRG